MVEKPDYFGEMIRGCDALIQAVKHFRMEAETRSSPDVIAKAHTTIQERSAHLDEAFTRWQCVNPQG